MTYEYLSGVRNVDESWRPHQLPFQDDSFCMWDARPNIPEFSDG